MTVGDHVELSRAAAAELGAWITAARGWMTAAESCLEAKP